MSRRLRLVLIGAYWVVALGVPSWLFTRVDDIPTPLAFILGPLCGTGATLVLMLLNLAIEAAVEAWDGARAEDEAQGKRKRDERLQRAVAQVDLLVREGLLAEESRNDAVDAYMEAK